MGNRPDIGSGRADDISGQFRAGIFNEVKRVYGDVSGFHVNFNTLPCKIIGLLPIDLYRTVGRRDLNDIADKISHCVHDLLFIFGGFTTCLDHISVSVIGI